MNAPRSRRGPHRDPAGGLLAVGLLLLLAGVPHGGIPMGPKQPTTGGPAPPSSTGSGSTPPPAGTGGPGAAGKPGAAAPAPGIGTTPDRDRARPGPSPSGAPGSGQAPARTPSGRGAAPVSGLGGPAVRSAASWEDWWLRHQDRFLDLRTRLGREAGGQASGAAHPLTGLGRGERGASRRAASDEVAREIVPALFELLADDQPEVVDSALIALGRCADESEAQRLDAALQPLLAHPVLSVQTSAVLALGVHGSARAVPLLGALMSDTAAGRRAVGGGQVPPPVRSLAALALGLGNHEAAVPLLGDLVLHLPDAQRDLKICALTALGLTANAAGDEVLRLLSALLQDRRVDSVLKAHAAVALARLDGGTRREALPALLDCLQRRDTDDLVRAACVAALGRLGGGADRACHEALLASAVGSRHEPTRHAALMALAEIGLRDLSEGGLATDLHARLGRLFVEGLRGDRAQADVPWAALAAGLYASGGGPAAAELRREVLARLDTARDAAVRGAVQLALGLAGEAAAAPALRADLRDPGDPALRGYAAVALGLLDDAASADTLRAACAEPACEPGLREQLAVALGLLGDPQVVPALVSVLETVEVHETSLAAARALGRLGDRAAIPALLRLARDPARQPVTRGMAAVALGLLGERGALPWNAPLKELDPGVARTPSLDLVLDIL